MRYENIRYFFPDDCQEVTAQDIAGRMITYVEKIDEPLFEYDQQRGDHFAPNKLIERAQRRWAGCDMLVHKLAEKCDPHLCYAAAVGLIDNKEDDPYLVNVGIALLGQPQVHKTQFGAPESLEKLLDLLYSFVPSHLNPLSQELIKAPQNAPITYNFIQAIEAMLQCNKSLEKDYRENLTYTERTKYYAQKTRILPFAIVLELHTDLAAKCMLLAELPDMKRTEFAKLFPRYTSISDYGLVDLT